MVMLAGKRQNAGHRCFGLRVRIDAADRHPLVVNAKHEFAGAVIAEANKALKRMHDELHGRFVVVHKQHAVERAVRHGATSSCLMGASSSSRIAAARVQPAEARSIFTGKHETMNPVEGRSSRLCSFSMWQ